MGVFGSNLKKILSYLKSAFSNLLKCKVSCKTQKLEILDQKYLIKKPIVIFDISPFEFVFWQNFELEQKRVYFGPKIPYLGIFGLQF